MSVEKVSPDDKKPNARYSKYTDPYRTSSSSYKPPMTKDAILNKKEPAQGETSIFSAFSYIKHMFTGNPDSSSNTKSVSNQGKHDLTKESKIKGDKTVPVKNDPRKSDSKDLVVHDLVASQSHDKVNSGRLSPVASNLTSVGSHKPDSKGSKTNVKLSERYNKPTQKSKNEPKGELPNYKPVRFVENRSTYLHTPEKQGTASFRVTTATKSSTIPMPTILSPIIDKHMKDISTSAAKMKGSKYNRKQSTSPVKVDKKDKFQSRLRSKSTQDNTASTTRPVSFSPSQSSFAHISPKLRSKSQGHCLETRQLVANVKTSSKPSFSVSPKVLFTEDSNPVTQVMVWKRTQPRIFIAGNKGVITKTASPSTEPKKVRKDHTTSGSTGTPLYVANQVNNKHPRPISSHAKMGPTTKDRSNNKFGPTLLTPTLLEGETNKRSSIPQSYKPERTQKIYAKKSTENTKRPTNTSSSSGKTKPENRVPSSIKPTLLETPTELIIGDQKAHTAVETQSRPKPRSFIIRTNSGKANQTIDSPSSIPPSNESLEPAPMISNMSEQGSGQAPKHSRFSNSSQKGFSSKSNSKPNGHEKTINSSSVSPPIPSHIQHMQPPSKPQPETIDKTEGHVENEISNYMGKSPFSEIGSSAAANPTPGSSVVDPSHLPQDSIAVNGTNVDGHQVPPPHAAGGFELDDVHACIMSSSVDDGSTIRSPILTSNIGVSALGFGGGISAKFPSVALMGGKFDQAVESTGEQYQFHPTVLDCQNNETDFSNSSSYPLSKNPSDPFTVDEFSDCATHEQDRCNSSLPGRRSGKTYVPPTCLLSENDEERVYEIGFGPSFVEKKILSAMKNESQESSPERPNFSRRLKSDQKNAKVIDSKPLSSPTVPDSTALKDYFQKVYIETAARTKFSPKLEKEEKKSPVSKSPYRKSDDVSPPRKKSSPSRTRKFKSVASPNFIHRSPQPAAEVHLPPTIPKTPPPKKAAKQVTQQRSPFLRDSSPKATVAIGSPTSSFKKQLSSPDIVATPTLVEPTVIQKAAKPIAKRAKHSDYTINPFSGVMKAIAGVFSPSRPPISPKKNIEPPQASEKQSESPLATIEKQASATLKYINNFIHDKISSDVKPPVPKPEKGEVGTIVDKKSSPQINASAGKTSPPLNKPVASPMKSKAPMDKPLASPIKPNAALEKQAVSPVKQAVSPVRSNTYVDKAPAPPGKTNTDNSVEKKSSFTMIKNTIANHFPKKTVQVIEKSMSPDLNKNRETASKGQTAPAAKVKPSSPLKAHISNDPFNVKNKPETKQLKQDVNSSPTKINPVNITTATKPKAPASPAGSPSLNPKKVVPRAKRHTSVLDTLESPRRQMSAVTSNPSEYASSLTQFGEIP